MVFFTLYKLVVGSKVGREVSEDAADDAIALERGKLPKWFLFSIAPERLIAW